MADPGHGDPNPLSDTYKTAKNNFIITSWAVDIIRTAYYIHCRWGGEINFCCLIRLTERWASEVVI